MTGGAGFIASHVVILLCKKYPQYRIVNFDRLDYCACLENVAEVSGLPNYTFIKGDICSADLVNYVLDTEEIDTVMHFAAQTHVDNSFGNSFQFTRNNILGTHVLLEAAKIHKLKLFIHVSTDEVYGEGETMESKPMMEDHVLEPTNPSRGPRPPFFFRDRRPPLKKKKGTRRPRPRPSSSSRATTGRSRSRW